MRRALIDRCFSREIEVKSSGDRSMFVLALASRHQSSLSRAVADCGRFAALVGSVASCRHRLVRHNADEKGPAPKAIARQASRSAIWCRRELAEIGALDVGEAQRVL